MQNVEGQRKYTSKIPILSEHSYSDRLKLVKINSQEECKDIESYISGIL